MSKFSARFSNPKDRAVKGEFERNAKLRKKRLAAREFRRARLGVDKIMRS